MNNSSTIASGEATNTPHWTGATSSSEWLTAARRLVPELAATAVESDLTGDFVQAGFDTLRQQGFMSMLVPSELGGGGATYRQACAVLSELAHGCPSTALALSMHSHLVAAQVWRHQRDLPAPVLQRIANEQIVLVSTGASDWLESNGTCLRVEGGYRVTARKMPASGAPAGHVFATSFFWADGPDGPSVIHASVPASAEGVSMERTWDTMGMRATGSETVVFDDVFVPDAAVALVRPAGVWHPVWGTVLGSAMPLIMSVYVGVAESAVQRALALAGAKADRPEVAPLVGRMINKLMTARDAVRAMIDANDDHRFDNSVENASAFLSRKAVAAEAAIDAVTIALEVGGGAAYSRSSGIERLFRDVQGARYHPLPAAQQERFTGRVALGLAPVG